jgi:predicted Zn-dependent protease
MLAALNPCAPAEAPQTTKEEKLGERAAAELEKFLKPLPDHPELPRLESIANEIASHTERPQVHYSVKVVASKSINAISLPGGRLYVTEGVLEAVESEDELAAILAHEIAHNSLRHALLQQERASRADIGLIAGVLAGILSNRGEVALMASQIQQGALNHYGRRAEMEADRHALMYLSKTNYMPTALLTVMEGLAAIEESRWRPQVMTTADTHPLARERVKEIEALLIKMGVDIAAERRHVTDRFRLEVKSIEKEGRTIAEITLNGRVVFSPAEALGADSPLQRAENYAASIRQALNEGIQLTDLEITEAGDLTLLQARGRTLIEVTAGDAAFHKQPAHDLAEEAKKALELALYAEKVSRPF